MIKIHYANSLSEFSNTMLASGTYQFQLHFNWLKKV